mmetsp:Transcript_36715/g.86205  ORF Transcript_36715/g.86205 Transcript_36715/m.86205 type:complete len:200 (-) Transcript_36715:100-699(-)
MHTIVAVRLSITALKKKAMTQTMGISRPGLPCVWRTMKAVTTAKPFMWSIDSTTHIAGSRNKMTLPTSKRPFISSSSRRWCPSTVLAWMPAAWYVHITDARTSMMADLSSRSTSSSATNVMPVMKSAARTARCVAASSSKFVGQPKKAKVKTTAKSARPAIFMVRRVVVTAPCTTLSFVQATSAAEQGLETLGIGSACT